jgi:hypothetical protein
MSNTCIATKRRSTALENMPITFQRKKNPLTLPLKLHLTPRYFTVREDLYHSIRLYTSNTSRFSACCLRSSQSSRVMVGAPSRRFASLGSPGSPTFWK